MAILDPSEALRQRLVAGKQWIDTTHGESNEQLRGRCDHITGKFLASLEGLTDEQLKFPEREGKWSVYEVCLHTSHAVRNVAHLSTALTRGIVPEFANNIQLGVLDEDPGEFSGTRRLLEEAFAAARATVDLYDGEFNEETTVGHPYFGPLNARQWFVFNLMHINYHTGQIERIKSAPGFPA